MKNKTKDDSNQNNYSRYGSISFRIGILMILIFTLADLLNYGTAPEQFGVIQIVGTITGIILFIIGIFYKIYRLPNS